MRSLLVNYLALKLLDIRVFFLCNLDKNLPEASRCYQRELGSPPLASSKASLLTDIGCGEGKYSVYAVARQGRRAIHARKTQTP